MRLQRLLERQNCRRRHEASRRSFFQDAMHLLEFNGIDGDYVEFGCDRAQTFRLAHRFSRDLETHRHLWAIDSFRGIPAPKGFRDLHPRWSEGERQTSEEQFRRLCRRAGIPAGARTVVRATWEQLPHLAPERLPHNISFAYINCPLHSSVSSVLQCLAPRLKQGMLVAFENHFAWSRFHRSGDQAALDQFSQINDAFQFHPYRSFGLTGASFLVAERFA